MTDNTQVKVSARWSSRMPDAAGVLAVAGLVVAAYAAFYGRYAFDDSYVGYANAENLLAGNGMTFDPGVRLLTTSAPLAVPLYASLARLTSLTIVDAAQLLSAVAFAIVSFGSYAVVRRFAMPLGAFLGTAATVTSPFILLLWSHESLLAAAALTISMLFYSYGRASGAALWLGAASLLRAETLVALPFLTIARARSNGMRSAVLFALASMAPFLIWTIFATIHFGTATSTTVASKRAQFLYYDITPYLYGSFDFLWRILASDGSPLLPALLMLATSASWVLIAAARIHRPVSIALVLWCLATTCVYVVLELPFYFWFGLQWAVIAGYAAAVAFPNVPMRPHTTAVPRTLKAAAIVIAVANVQFLASQLALPALKTTYYDWVIMPDIRGNAYRSLGDWIARNTPTGASFTYPEFGQVHYYSGHPLVDYLGIATPGAAEELRTGNAIWTFERYHPAYYIDDRTWWYFSNPTEFDWFREAYSPAAHLHFSGDIHRNDFTIYRLTRPDAIPQPSEIDVDAKVVALPSERSGSYEFAFAPSEDGIDGVDLRLFFRTTCAPVRLAVYDGDRLVGQRSQSVDVAPAVTRLSLFFAPQEGSGGSRYRLQVHTCAPAIIAPPVKLRTGFIVFGKPRGEFGAPAQALTVYRPARL